MNVTSNKFVKDLWLNFINALDKNHCAWFDLVLQRCLSGTIFIIYTDIVVILHSSMD